MGNPGLQRESTIPKRHQVELLARFTRDKMGNFKKSFHAWLAIFGLLLVSPSLFAQYTLLYSTNDGVITLTGYSGAPVTVTIPNFVNNIGISAFNGCLNLATITIPDTVTNIGEAAFYLCTNLTDIEVDAQNQIYSSVGGILFDKEQTTLLQYPDGLTGGYAIPAGVANVGSLAFWNAPNLTSVLIPSSVTNLEVAPWLGPFKGCTSLSNITVDLQSLDFCSVSGVLFDKAKINLLQFPVAPFQNYIVPATVTSIGDNAFNYCCSLTNITLPSGLGSIGNTAFFQCSNLNNVIIPPSVTNLGTLAFGYCTNLTEILFAGDAPNEGQSLFGFGNNTIATIYTVPNTSGWDEFTSIFGYSTVLWNPSIQTTDSRFGVQTNQFGFTVTGTPNIPIVVQATADLNSGAWTPLQSCTITNGSIFFSDPAWTNYPSRFYSIRFP